jgi:hypothetical protein
MTTTLDPVSPADLLDYEEAEEAPETAPPVGKDVNATPARAAGVPWAYVGLGALAGVGIGLTVGLIAGVRLRKGDDHSVRMGPFRPTVRLAPKFAPELEVKAFNNRQTWSFARGMGARLRKRGARRMPARRRGAFAAIFGRRGPRALPVWEKRRVPFALPPYFRRMRAA